MHDFSPTFWGLSNIANGRPLGLAIPFVPSHTMFQSVPFAMPCTYYPSHPLYHRRDWTDEGCTKVSDLLCPVPTVHPIPLYHGRDWMDEGCTRVSHLLPCTYCPSHPIVPWEGRGFYWSVPFAMLCTYCPSYPIVSWEGLDRRRLYQSVPFAMPCTYCSSHSIVPWEEMDGLRFASCLLKYTLWS